MKLVRISCFAALLILFIPGVFAQTTQTGQTSDDDKWTTTPSIYLWLSGLRGNVGTPDRQASVHASPWEVLSHFRFGLMGEADIRHKRFIAPIDIVWVRLGEDKASPYRADLGASVDVKVDQVVITPKMGYRVVDQEKLKVDALMGFRYWHVGSELEFSSNVGGRNLSVSQNWIDPLVGGRITLPLSPKVELIAAGDVGGWGAGAQLDYQVVGALGYRIKPGLAAQIGWRYLDVDRRTSTSVFDVTMSGAFLGFTFGGR